MRISVNLATRPFVEIRPLLARLRLVMLGLLVLAVGLGVWLQALRAKAATAQARMATLKAETSEYTDERTRNEARMRQPQNKAVLDRSQFLNALFARKSFSWTATMMDLERVLPAGVQVTSIDPVITKEGDVQIRLRVSGDRDRTILLVRNLEHSQRFVGPRLVSETAQTKERATALGSPGVQTVSGVPGALAAGAGVEFDILSGYNPLPEPPTVRSAAGVADTIPAGYVVHRRKPSADVPIGPGITGPGITGPAITGPGTTGAGTAGGTR